MAEGNPFKTSYRVILFSQKKKKNDADRAHSQGRPTISYLARRVINFSFLVYRNRVGSRQQRNAGRGIGFLRAARFVMLLVGKKKWVEVRLSAVLIKETAPQGHS